MRAKSGWQNKFISTLERETPKNNFRDPKGPSTRWPFQTIPKLSRFYFEYPYSQAIKIFIESPLSKQEYMKNWHIKNVEKNSRTKR